MKNLKLFITALIITASLSAKAQSTTYVGIKCPDCKSDTWTYTKEGYYELIENNETAISIDWKTLEVIQDGRVYAMKYYKIGTDATVTIKFFHLDDVQEIKIWYDAQGRYKAHELKDSIM